jgi:hypothetical protein
MFRESEKNLKETPGCTFVMVGYRARQRGNSKLIWREQVVCNEVPGMEHDLSDGLQKET